MKTSVIRHRVADFLKAHAPFDVLSEQDLLDLAGSGRVKFHESDEYVFHQGDAKGPVVWIIQQGRVELMEERPSGGRLRDVLGEGDLLGLDRFTGDGTCLCSARTTTDVTLYGIAAAAFEALLPRYPAVKRYITAHASVSGIGFERTSWLDAEAPSLDFLRVRRLAVPPNAVTIASPPNTRAAVRSMLSARTEELAVTTDGTPHSRVDAVLNESDLALFCGHNPMRLVREIRNASAAAELVALLRLATGTILEGLAQPRDVDDCCRIGTSIVAAVAEACIRLAGADIRAAGIEPPGAPFCWVMFGHSARGDLLCPALPTIAAVYDDAADAFLPGDSMYFAAVAGETLAWFHDCGWDSSAVPWPEGARPCMPLSEWQRLYRDTIRNPLGSGLYARREFFDIRPLSGDASILNRLQEEIVLELRDHELTIALLANDTLAHLPPLTFFRGVALGLDGVQRESFDISTSAVAPIADAARVLAISKGRVATVNTLDRLESAEADFPDAAAMLREAADAFRIALYYQALSGGSQIDAGRLGRFDQLLLKTAFTSIQRLLEFTAFTFTGEL
jgi:signal-transduction protein with cAMP-binding, CBS, and nucleotidyltransferase domain